jgi:hypothetical protein
MADQGNREREGNLGKTNREKDNPTGTSGRQGTSGDRSPGSEGNRQEGGDRNRRQNTDDEDSPLGGRNTNR